MPTWNIYKTKWCRKRHLNKGSESNDINCRTQKSLQPAYTKMILQQTAKLRRVCNCSQVKLTREANCPSQLTKTTKSEFSKRPLKVFKSSRILARINKPWIYSYIFSHLDFACFVRKPVVFLNAARLKISKYCPCDCLFSYLLCYYLEGSQ